MPIIFFVQYCSFLPGAVIGRVFGTRVAVIISAITMTSGYALLCFFRNYYIVMFAMAIFGAGVGIANLPILRNSWNYFPKKLGLVNGIITSGGSIGSSILTILADFIFINPNQKSPENPPYYGNDIGKNLENILPFLTLFIGALSLISVFLIVPFKEENELISFEIPRKTLMDKEGQMKLKENFAISPELENDKNTEGGDKEETEENGKNKSDHALLDNIEMKHIGEFNSRYTATMNEEEEEGLNTVSLVREGYCSKKNAQLSVFCIFILSKRN